jgi:hypothetical protein
VEDLRRRLLSCVLHGVFNLNDDETDEYESKVLAAKDEDELRRLHEELLAK